MKAARRKWTQAQREKIVKHSHEHNVPAAAKKYGVSEGLIYSWRQRMTGSKSKNRGKVLRVNRAIKRADGAERAGYIGKVVTTLVEKNVDTVTVAAVIDDLRS